VTLAALLTACPGTIDDPARFFADAPLVVDAGEAVDVPVPAVEDDVPAAAVTDAATTGVDAASPCAAYVEGTLLPRTCATVYCHGAAEPAAGLDLASPDLARRLVGVRATTNCRGVLLIDRARPQASLMLVKLGASPGCGSRMPLGQTALSAAEISCMRVWVAGLAAP